MYRLMLLLVVIALSACTGTVSNDSSRAYTVTEQQYTDAFDSPNQWDTIDRAGMLLAVEDSVYRGLLSQRGGLLWGVNYVPHDDILLETSLSFKAANDKTITGLVCRATAAPNERGYLFLISQDGAYSIRKLSPNQDDALVKWQNHRAIHTDGRANEIRALCMGDTLRMEINDVFVKQVHDNSFSDGYAGLVVGLPASAPDTPTLVQFEYLTAWSVE